MASGDKFYIADKTTLDEVNGKIGNESDTGGSSSVGTVMAKGNAVLEKIGATNDAQSSSTTTGSIFAKLNYLVAKMVSVYSWCSSMYSWFSTKIGNTSDTGGSATAGTVMAKENAVLTEVNKIGETTDAGATEAAGTVMGKLNNLITGEDKINNKIVPDNDFIKASTNYTATTIDNLSSTETEILNISGEGFVRTLFLAASTGTTTYMKVYVDDELFFDCHVSSNSASRSFGYVTGDISRSKIGDLSDWINGGAVSDSETTVNYLRFENSLRILAYSTETSANNRVLIKYGLVG